jgi:16S rRNA (guanine527-N7)-methyltransferase
MDDRQHRLSNVSGQNVSRETLAKLEILVAELGRWHCVKNLVGPSALAEVWERHVGDSLQLLCLAPDAKRWLDLGSGAGFPGLVLAIALAETGGARVHLIESDARKCAFLREVARLTGAPAIVHHSRIEDVIATFSGMEVVTARALAPLQRLFEWTQTLLRTGTVGLFLKGRNVEAELTEAGKSWRFDVDLIPSRTDSEARIVRVRSLSRKPEHA